MVQVVEEFRWLVPPADYRSTVERLVQSVPPEYLKGLDRVRLLDTPALQRVWPAKKIPDTEYSGCYHRAKKGRKAEIELNLDVVTATLPNWALKVPVIREGVIAWVLFHEIGHHIHFAVEPDPRPVEEVANIWYRFLLRNYFLRRFRYLRI